MTTLPKAIHRSNPSLTKLPMASFTELEQKICVVTQNTLSSQSSLKTEKMSWRKQVPYLQIIPQSYSN